MESEPAKGGVTSNGERSRAAARDPLTRVPGELANDSAIGRLLEEISWEGASVRAYREGGRGRENVLTTEVWQLLHYLPRDAYLGKVLRAVDSSAGFVPFDLDPEGLSIGILPENIALPQGKVVVQPDVELSSEDCYFLVEAKRIRRSSFQPLQLAREMVAAHVRADGRRPVLLLVLGAPPPVRVKGSPVAMTPADAVRAALAEVCGSDTGLVARIEGALDECLCWTTWDRIQEMVRTSAESPEGDDPATKTERRLAADLVRAIDWHR